MKTFKIKTKPLDMTKYERNRIIDLWLINPLKCILFTIVAIVAFCIYKGMEQGSKLKKQNYEQSRIIRQSQ